MENESTTNSATSESSGDEKALELIGQALNRSDDEPTPSHDDENSVDEETKKADGPVQKPEEKEEPAPEEGKTQDDAPKVEMKEAPAPEAKPEKPADEDDEFDKIDLDAFSNLESDSYGELSVKEWASVIKAVKNLREEMAMMRDDFRDVANYASERRRDELDEQIDDAFEGLGEDFVNIFGRGSARKIDKELVDNRNRVLKEAGYLLEGHKNDGDAISLEEAIRKAAVMLYSEQLSAKPQTRKSQFISKPSGAGNDEKGDAAALRVIERFMKKDK